MTSGTFTMHGFMPHGMCYLWRPDILALHVGSDAIIALSYFSIPVALLIFAKRRPDLSYRPVVLLFTAFILLCGLSHAFSIWTVWTPDYVLEGFVKAATAIASLATAAVLWPMLPRALALPSTESLKSANAALLEEIGRRADAEQALQSLARNLERRVEKRTAELERANAALRQFATTASHDLQAPLRHIGLFAELTRREAADLGPAAAHLDRIESSAARLQTLVGVLLEYARLVNTPSSVEPIDPAACARAAAASHEPEIRAAGASLAIGDIPAAEGDPVLIERVFDNLVSNALRYGGDAATIAIKGERRGDMVAITVTDDGPGVPAGKAEAIFEMLRRFAAPRPGEDQDDGAGVGLAFCRTIIESHGGTIELDTAYTGGARFVFTLPAAN
ncbi:MAG: ATP-binding protein [Oceanicaulis sp.]